MRHRLFGLRAIAIALTVTFTVFSASAEIYKWTDANGKVHFGDRPPPKTDTSVLDLRINTIEAPNIERLEQAVIADDRVVMYSTQWCGVCKKAKRYFEANKVRYKEYDVETSAKGKRDFQKLNGTGVPIILVGKQRMNGFNADRFEAMRSN